MQDSKLYTLIGIITVLLFGLSYVGTLLYGNGIRSDMASSTPTIATYDNPGYGISFEYPSADLLRETEDVGLDTILITDLIGDAAKISISPFDENIKILTEARVHKDLPNLQMENVEHVYVAYTVPALSFTSVGAEGNTSQEVWFVHGGYLYQISTRNTAADLRKQILDSLKLPEPKLDSSVLAGDNQN